MNLESVRGNSMSSTGDPSQHLRELLNVGKPPIASSAEGQVSTNGINPARAMTSHKSEVPVNQSNGDMNQKLNPQLVGVRSNVKQNVVLPGDDSRASFPLYGQEVIITPSANSSVRNPATASSQVKCTPVVKYDWESKYYIGNMVTVNKEFIVYVLKTQSGFGVRVINRQTSQRALLKGFKDMIMDLAFSHYNSNLLACVDRMGNLMVWKLTEDGDSIQSKIILSVDGESTHPSEYHRVVWGPYLPEDPTSGEPEASYLGVSHNSQVEMWDIDENFLEGLTLPVTKAAVSESFIVVLNGHDREITDLAVAPDGSVMATASLDGTVKFWEMLWDSSDAPRRLHRFLPHEGRPVSSLLFCDNHKTQDPSVAFWRFLLTGADFNSEIKLWCTVSWKCLQVVRFLTSDPQPCLKVCLDQSASFVLASDVKRKVFYVLKLFQDIHKGNSHFSSLSEFILNEPMLNFCVATAGHIRSKLAEEEDAEDAHLSGEYLEEGTNLDGEAASDDVSVLVRMYCVFSRALQELHVRFQPNSSVDNDVPSASISTTSREDIALRDGLSDVSFSTTEQSTDAEGSQPDLIGGISPARSDLQPTPAQSMTSSFTGESTQSPLLTPDALRSGTFNQKDTNSLQQLRDSTSSSASSFTQVTRTNMSTVDDIMSPQASSAGEGSLTVTPSSLQEPSPNSSRVLTPSQVPLPLSASSSRDTSLQVEEEDNAPKSPPNTPEEGDHTNLSRLSVASAEDLAERLHQHPRLEKRLSDSSAEVAKILQNEDDQETEQWNNTDRVENDDTPVGPTAIPKAEVQVGDLVDLSFSPVTAAVGSRNTTEERNIQAETQTARDKNDDEEDEDTKEMDPNRWASVGGRMSLRDRPEADHEVKDEQLGAAARSAPNELVHPKVATVKQGELESASATGSDSESGSGDATRKELRRKKGRGNQLDVDIQTVEEMQEIKTCLNKIMTAFQRHQEDMKKLRQDITKSQQSNSIIQSMKSRIEKLEKNINTKVDSLVNEHTKAERQRLDTLLQERQRMDKQRQDQQLESMKSSLKQTINQSMAQNLSKTVQKDVMPEISESLSGLTEQLSQIAAEKMTTADQQIRENISKLIKNRNFGDNIAQTTAQMMVPQITQLYRDNFFKNVIPAFDNACKNMFQQMASSFQKGTDHCIEQMQRMTKENTNSMKQERDMLFAEMRSLWDEQQRGLEKLKTDIQESLQSSMSQELQHQSKRMEKVFESDMQRLIVREMQPILREHKELQESIVSVVRSQAATPVPQAPDIARTKEQIAELLKRNKINDAFQVALNAADLRALTYACKEVSTENVFGDECALEQPVLLSLIHQLSHDLTTNTDIKISYLEDCILAIDSDSQVTKGHLPNILEDLISNIDAYTQSPSSTASFTKRLKRVRKMAEKLK